MTAEHDDHVIQLSAPSGLLIEASIAPGKILDDFYRDYDAAFVLANEKELHAGFTACLELNSGAAYAELTQQFGLFREFVIVVYDPESGARIGGANFIAFPLKAVKEVDKPLLSINLNYIFINQNQRGRGYFRQLIKDLPEIAFRLLIDTNPLDLPGIWRSDDFHASAQLPQALIFLEQNDPYLMSAGDYKLDTEYTGLDQIARIGIWTRLGAKIIDFPYVQPALTDAQDAEHNLVLALLGIDADIVDPCILHDHLQRFFGISVLKGSKLSLNAVAAQQLSSLLDACQQGKAIPLLNGQSLNVAASGSLRPASLRDALRR